MCGVKWDELKEMDDLDAEDSFSDSERDNYNTLGFADHGGCIVLNGVTILSQRDRRHKQQQEEIKGEAFEDRTQDEIDLMTAFTQEKFYHYSVRQKLNNHFITDIEIRNVVCSYEVLNEVLRAIEGDTAHNEIYSFIFSPGQGDAIDTNLLNTIA